MSKQTTETKQDDWWRNNWRNVGAAVYYVICLNDFVIGPFIFNTLQFYNPGQEVSQWTSMTLQSGGLFHIAFGALLGITAHGRTKEKLAGVHNDQSQQIPTIQNQPANVFAEAPSIPTGKFGKIVPVTEEPEL